MKVPPSLPIVVRDEPPPVVDDTQLPRCVRMLKASIPIPLRHARLDTFVLHGQPHEQQRQQDVLDRLRQIDVASFVRERGQLFFWGTVGTGKDHLMIAMGKLAAVRGSAVRFCDGEEWFNSYLFGDRDRALDRVVVPDVLLLSDPATTARTEGRGQALRTLVNARWKAGRPTWVTCNIRTIDNPDDERGAHHSLGTDVFSRLSQRTEFFCHRWGDYRQRDSITKGT